MPNKSFNDIVTDFKTITQLTLGVEFHKVSYLDHSFFHISYFYVEPNFTHDFPVVLEVNRIITLSRTPCADSVPKSVPNGTVPADL